MSKSELNLNYKQAVNAIATCGSTNTILLQGPPGIGKSSILHTLAERMPDYLPAYIDVANLDLGDIAMPVINKEQMTTSYAPNARFGVAEGQTRPVLLMLDELGKASRPVLNMLLPVMLEGRLGDRHLPPGSITFASTNLATDGVGDNIPAHAHNRMTVVRMANPTCDEWLDWAVPAGVTPEVCAFAKQFPQVFDCYADLKDNEKNGYIFNPRNGQTKAFCSPRSLEKSSNLIKNRAVLDNALIPLLAGTVGEAAARDMEALVNLVDQVPTLEEIVAKPKSVKLPDAVTGYFLLAFMMAGRLDNKNIDSIETYLRRWDNYEATALALHQICNNSRATPIVAQSSGMLELTSQYAKHM